MPKDCCRTAMSPALCTLRLPPSKNKLSVRLLFSTYDRVTTVRYCTVQAGSTLLYDSIERLTFYLPSLESDAAAGLADLAALCARARRRAGVAPVAGEALRANPLCPRAIPVLACAAAHPCVFPAARAHKNQSRPLAPSRTSPAG
jgi:hypothetical protein